MFLNKKEYKAEKTRCERIIKRNPGKATDYYLCLIPEDSEFTTAFGKGRPEQYEVFTKEQKGYEIASEKTPYFYKRTR